MKQKRRISPHFYDTEFACKCCGQIGDQKQLMILVARLEMLRSKFNRPIKVISGYRCPDHNKKCGGALKSQHLLTQAADIQVDGISPERIARYAHGIFNGIGLYDTFTHVDTRTKRASWDHRTKEKPNASDDKDTGTSTEEQLPEKSRTTESEPKQSRSKKRSSKKDD